MRTAIGSVVLALAGTALVLNDVSTIGVVCLCFAIALAVD